MANNQRLITSNLTVPPRLESVKLWYELPNIAELFKGWYESTTLEEDPQTLGYWFSDMLTNLWWHRISCDCHLDLSEKLDISSNLLTILV